MRKVYFIVVALIISNCLLAQHPGTLDLSFGDSGKVIGEKNSYLPALAVQTDQKIIVGGDAPGFFLRRFLPNGDIDTTFGNKGNIGNIFFGYSQELNVITMLPDGKFITAATGRKDNYYGEFILLARYNQDGSIDTSFGDSGRTVKDFGNASEPKDVEVQPDGKLIIGGTASSKREGLFAFVSRFTADGDVDTSFGKKGISTLALFVNSTCNNITLQPDGKIVVPMYALSSPTACGLARYNANGTLDKSFDGTGYVITDLPGGSEYLIDAVIDDNNKIVATGRSHALYGSDGEMTAIRYNNDGSIDKSFGINGVAFIDFDKKNYSQGLKIAKQPNGKLVIGGTNGYPFMYPTTSEVAYARINDNGALDSSFGINGKQIASFSSYDYLYNMLLQPDGKILSSIDDGGALGDELYYFLTRYYGDPIKQQNPIVKKIKRWIRNHTLNWQYNADVDHFIIEQSNNGVNGFKEIARVKANEQRTMMNEQLVYSYPLNAIANSQQLKANSKFYYRITAISNNRKVVSDVISDENVISITISPNPVKDVLKISGLPINQKATISIINRNGNVLQTSISNFSTYNMNVSQLKNGLYNVQVTTGNKTQTMQFIKE